MAPPRHRTAAVQDDSRSEASSGAREHKGGAAKGRKAVGGSREPKISAAVANVTSAPANQPDQADDQPKIPWSEMPLDFLHAYRHTYKLSCPSAYSGDYSRILLTQGIGLRSPTSIAAQRARLLQQKTDHDHDHANRPSAFHPRAPSGRIQPRKDQTPDPKATLHRIIAQDRVSKDHLATAVRKHFNSAALAEQEAIARFLYKVREEGRGRQFRLRFLP